jgi:hypothetical protein
MNAARTELPGQISGGVGNNIMDTQLGMICQYSTGSSQGSREIASYPPLSGGLGGSPVDASITLNALGLGENWPTNPYATDSTSEGVQVSRPCFPLYRAVIDRARIGNALDPTRIQQWLRPPSRSNELHQWFAWRDILCKDRRSRGQRPEEYQRCDHGAIIFTQRSVHNNPWDGWSVDHARCNLCE